MRESSWNTAEKPAACAALGLAARKGAPRKRMLPSSGLTAPARIWMKVLFPAPFSPISAWTSPASAWNSARDSAAMPP